MVAVAIILDSVGIGKSVNEQAVENSIAENGILYIMTACFIGPVVEEFFYRGILFNVLNGRKKSVIRGMVAVLLSALIFAFIHVSFTNFTVTDVLANLPILALGSTTAALYWKTDNIICPILLHVAINAIGTFG